MGKRLWSALNAPEGRQTHPAEHGYSTCHWCHVMARKALKTKAVAAYMNDHFINIKLDREERPDLDAFICLPVKPSPAKGAGSCFSSPHRAKPIMPAPIFRRSPSQRLQSWMQAFQFAAYNFYKTGALWSRKPKNPGRMERRENASPS